MIYISNEKKANLKVEFIWEKETILEEKIGSFLKGTYLETYCHLGSDEKILYIGCGEKENITLQNVREIFATIAKAAKTYLTGDREQVCNCDINQYIELFGEKSVLQMVLGLQLGNYKYHVNEEIIYAKEPIDKGIKLQEKISYQLSAHLDKSRFLEVINEAQELSRGIEFARTMVNRPGNQLRPEEFTKEIIGYISDTSIEVEVLPYEEMKKLGLGAIVAVGESSEFLPRLMILRYKGNPQEEEIYGLVGKGVTCDTGGYCLKGASSMAGIKGDMAGAAAVVGAMRAIAKEKLRINVTGLLPICENRISKGALLPGDVIKSYSGKLVEILNTDAEGRLILADAISFGILKEKVTSVIDIATLTGAVWTTLGYTIAGALSNADDFYKIFTKGLAWSNEEYLRFPYKKEHEKMIKSKVADIKNTGEDCCGFITAGLFIKAFCEEKPWIHLDIAGTAWSNTPQFAYESPGATGAGVTSLYFAMKEASKQRYNLE